MLQRSFWIGAISNAGGQVMIERKQGDGVASIWKINT